MKTQFPKTQHLARTVLLSAAAFAALAGGGQASLLTPDPSDVVSQNDARHLVTARADLAPTLEQMLEAFNFQDADSATYFVRQTAMAEGLAGRGLTRTGGGVMGGQQMDIWYSAAEDRSVVCVGGADGGRYSQAAYQMPGKVRRGDLVPLP